MRNVLPSNQVHTCSCTRTLCRVSRTYRIPCNLKASIHHSTCTSCSRQCSTAWKLVSPWRWVYGDTSGYRLSMLMAEPRVWEWPATPSWADVAEQDKTKEGKTLSGPKPDTNTRSLLSNADQLGNSHCNTWRKLRRLLQTRHVRLPRVQNPNTNLATPSSSTKMAFTTMPMGFNCLKKLLFFLQSWLGLGSKFVTVSTLALGRRSAAGRCTGTEAFEFRSRFQHCDSATTGSSVSLRWKVCGYFRWQATSTCIFISLQPFFFRQLRFAFGKGG